MRVNGDYTFLISSPDSSELNFQNNGSLEVRDGARFEITGNLSNSEFGVVGGSGSFQSEGFVNHGIIDIDNELLFESNVVLEETSSLSFDLGEDFVDLLTVDGLSAACRSVGGQHRRVGAR